MNSDYRELLNKYTKELSDVNSRIAVDKSKIKQWFTELELPEGTTIDDVIALRERLVEENKQYEATLAKLIEELEDNE